MLLNDLIEEATAGSLTSDNWQLIMNVCDVISQDPETNTQVAIKAIRTQLAKKDANTILRSLTLTVAVAENCGSRMKQEIASASFLQECLIKKLSDRKVHKELKFRVAEIIFQLNQSFKDDPSLKPIADAYKTVQTKYGQFLNTPPDKPAKKELSSVDRMKEDQELERALNLSAQEFEREKSSRQEYLNQKPLPSPSDISTVPDGSSSLVDSAKDVTNVDQADKKDSETTTISQVKRVCALYDLNSYEPDELSFKKGDVITVLESVYRDWWRGSLPNGATGIFPLNYVTPVVSKSPEELAREKKVEEAMMGTEIKKVDKLLSMLSSDPNTIQEEVVTDLYNSIVSHKSLLALFIDKYSTRRDELITLNGEINRDTALYIEAIDDVVSKRQLGYPSYSPYSAFSLNNARLEQQQTSAGFGNATLNMFNQS